MFRLFEAALQYQIDLFNAKIMYIRRILGVFTGNYPDDDD